MPIIDIDNLSYRYPDGTIGIDGVSIRVEKGAVVVITGPNGSGKTTLLKQLNGLLIPQSGIVKIDGKEVVHDLRRARQLVGMIFQDADNQIVGETVAADVAFGPENLCLAPNEISSRVCEVLQTIGLTALSEQSPYSLSGGEKRRLSIAGILAMDPEVVVFDEPFASLDYTGTRQVLQEIVRMKKAGKTLLISTHDLEKILHHADRLVVMDRGRIVRDGIPGQIIKDVERFGVREPCASRRGLAVESWLT
jgi:biotin transport system ATP-binding protein